LPWIIWCRTISLWALQAKKLILSERRLGHAKSFNPTNLKPKQLQNVSFLSIFSKCFSIAKQQSIHICQHLFLNSGLFFASTFFLLKTLNVISVISFITCTLPFLTLPIMTWQHKKNSHTLSFPPEKIFHQIYYIRFCQMFHYNNPTKFSSQNKASFMCWRNFIVKRNMWWIKHPKIA